MSGATILCYHSIASAGPKKAMQDDSVSCALFREHMAYLQEREYSFLSLGQLCSLLENRQPVPSRSVILTFDDGYRNNYTHAYPILAEFKIPATIFLTVSYIGMLEFPWLSKCVTPDNVEDLSPLNWSQVSELIREGIEMGSHSHTHMLLPLVNNTQLLEELSVSKQRIEEKIGQRVHSFALPYSFPIWHWRWPTFWPRLVDSLERSGYSSCCTLVRGHISQSDYPFRLKRIVITKHDNLPLFRAKISSAYSWTRVPQFGFQLLFKKYKV